MKQTVAPVAPAASTPHIVADKLAASQARASAALVLFVALVAAGAWGWDATGEPVTMVVVLLGLPALVYGIYLWRDADAERRKFYAAEVRDKEDHNRDTYIGDPFNNVRVPGQDGEAEDVIIPKPSNSAKGQPIMDGWGVSAVDLVAFAFEAETARGLKETAWVGKGVTQFILPSGKAVTQKRLRELQQALDEHGMASKPDGKWRLDWTAQRIAEHLKRGAQ